MYYTRCVCVYIHIHVHIYVERKRGRERGRGRERHTHTQRAIYIYDRRRKTKRNITNMSTVVVRLWGVIFFFPLNSLFSKFCKNKHVFL